eukprot:jgi/Chrzof1/12339/Cz06g31030.t1
MFADMQLGQDRGFSRQVAQNQIMKGFNEATNGITVGSFNNENYFINNWLGFLGTSCPLLPTQALGDVRIDIRFAPATALLADATAAAANPTYSIGNAYMVVRTVSIDDDLFYSYLAKRVEATLHIPFNSYTMVQGPLGGFTQTMRHSVNSQSVAMAIGTFLPSDYTSMGLNTNAKCSSYFSRFGHQLATAQLSVNNQNVGYPSTVFDCWASTVTDFIGQDTIGGSDPYLNSPSAWISGFFMHPLRLDLINDKSATLASGYDSRGSQLSLSWTTNAAAGAVAQVYPVIWTIHNMCSK